MAEALAIAAAASQSVDADGGTLGVANLPGAVCIFTISLRVNR